MTGDAGLDDALNSSVISKFTSLENGNFQSRAEQDEMCQEMRIRFRKKEQNSHTASFGTSSNFVIVFSITFTVSEILVLVQCARMTYPHI